MSGHGKWQSTRRRKRIGDAEYAGLYAEAEAEAEAELWLGQLVYDRRVALGLSQTESAERAGMTQSQVSRLETEGGNTPGDNPPITLHTARTGADRVNGMGQRSPSGWGGHAERPPGGDAVPVRPGKAG